LSSDDNLGNQFDGIDKDEETDITNDQAREQATADMNEPSDGPALDEETGENDNQPPNEPIPLLRRNRARTYGDLKGRDGDGSLPTIARPHEFCGGHHQAHVILQSIVMTQYNLRQGIKKFGMKGKAAVMEELQQLYDRDVMQPISKNDLSPEERKGALRYLMSLKEKRCRKIKGRGCADGRPQRDYMSKEDNSLPTVATEALMLTSVIEAIENRDVATCNIPGAFMQSDMKGKVIMKLEGVMAEVIIKIDPSKYNRARARKASHIRQANQGLIRHTAGSTAVLAEPFVTAAGVGFQDKSIRFLRCKQNSRWGTVYHCMAR
jgi:hypothetical protein